MKRLLLLSVTLLTSTCVMAKDYTVPADLPDATRTKMYSMVTDYNLCVMQAPLKLEKKTNVDWKKAGDKALADCDPKAQALKTYMINNNVDPNLADGIVNRMYSQAARHFMGAAMSQMASEASAMAHATPQK